MCSVWESIRKHKHCHGYSTNVSTSKAKQIEKQKGEVYDQIWQTEREIHQEEHGNSAKHLPENL